MSTQALRIIDTAPAEPSQFFFDKPPQQASNDTSMAQQAFFETGAIRGIVPRPASSSVGYFRLLQSFEGVVTERTEHSIFAQISDKTNSQNPDEIVEIPLEELTPEDLPIAVVGAIFYWSIGYKDSPGEPRRRISQIRFQRLPGWSRQELLAAQSFAAEYRSLFSDI